MKTTINKLFILIIATTLITLVTACDSSTLHQTLDNSDSETFIITGTISLNNVAASKVAIDETTANARQASSSFKISNDKYSYSVIAVQGDKTVNATISNSEDNYTYTLSLDSRGKWTIKAYLYYEEELIAQAEEEITISETATNGSSIPGSIILTFTPQINSSKQGAINLAIKNQVSDTASITLHWINGENTGLTVPTDQTKTITSSDQIVVFTYNSVTSDIYNVEIIFKNSTGKELYTCFETINVFANWTTDTWGGKSAYLNDKNEFVFSDTLKDSYAQKPHVFENSSEDPLFLLWSASPTESGIPEQALATNAVGSQVFDSVTEGMTITKPLECGYNYCFVDSTLYVPPYRYIQSYAGYTKDSSFDMTTLIPAPAVWFPENVNCLLLDDFVYFIFTLYNENDYTDYYFVGRYNTKDDSVIISPTPFNSSDSQRCTSLAVTHSYNPVDLETDPSSGVLYIVIEGYDMTLNETVLTLHRKPFKVVHDANGDVDYMVTEGLTYGEDDIEPASININDFDKTFKFGG